MAEDQDWVSMGVAAALSRDYAEQGREFVPHLTRLLTEALPDVTEPIMAGGFLAKKSVVGVRVILGDFQYVLDCGVKGAAQPSRTHTVRGIALKSEPMEIEEWLADVGAGIEAQMRRNDKVRAALGGLLGL